ncbi:MAG: deoxyribose-phosphate aldolase [Actinobacteria bacterium]|nr:MAG: deoxyribose-phosphate aldolase [Actinomycetota bacterium]
MRPADVAALAATMDQTLLKPTAGFSIAAEWMESSRDAGFATLCVSPFLVPLAAQRLAGTVTKVCSVAGFPLGYALTETKAEEAVHLVELGCAEVDMVMNVAAMLEGEETFVRDDIEAVTVAVAEASQGSALVKVILETAYLNDSQVARASELAVQAGAAFVKTSTGFGPRGASARDCEIMRAAVGPDIGVKAAGGIRDFDTALEMLDAGADRLGTSAGIEILAEAAGRGM